MLANLDDKKRGELSVPCLTEAQLTINLTKCDFAKATVTYLGKEVGQGEVCPVHAKVAPSTGD